MWYGNYNEFPITPGMGNLYVGDKKGLNTVCKCMTARRSSCQGVGYTNDLFRSVTNPDNGGTTPSICKGNSSVNNVLRISILLNSSVLPHPWPDKIESSSPLLI